MNHIKAIRNVTGTGTISADLSALYADTGAKRAETRADRAPVVMLGIRPTLYLPRILKGKYSPETVTAMQAVKGNMIATFATVHDYTDSDMDAVNRNWLNGYGVALRGRCHARHDRPAVQADIRLTCAACGAKSSEHLHKMPIVTEDMDATMTAIAKAVNGKLVKNQSGVTVSFTLNGTKYRVVPKILL